MNSLEVHEIGNKLSIITLSASFNLIGNYSSYVSVVTFAEACYFCTIRSWQEYYRKLMVNYKSNKSGVHSFLTFLQGAELVSSFFSSETLFFFMIYQPNYPTICRYNYLQRSSRTCIYTHSTLENAFLNVDALILLFRQITKNFNNRKLHRLQQPLYNAETFWRLGVDWYNVCSFSKAIIHSLVHYCCYSIWVIFVSVRGSIAALKQNKWGIEINRNWETTITSGLELQ